MFLFLFSAISEIRTLVDQQNYQEAEKHIKKDMEEYYF